MHHSFAPNLSQSSYFKRKSMQILLKHTPIVSYFFFFNLLPWSNSILLNTSPFSWEQELPGNFLKCLAILVPFAISSWTYVGSGNENIQLISPRKNIARYKTWLESNELDPKVMYKNL